MKTLTRVPNFGFGLLKSCLTFGYLLCSVQSKKNSTLHPTVHVYSVHVRIPSLTTKCSITKVATFYLFCYDFSLEENNERYTCIFMSSPLSTVPEPGTIF